MEEEVIESEEVETKTSPEEPSQKNKFLMPEKEKPIESSDVQQNSKESCSKFIINSQPDTVAYLFLVPSLSKGSLCLL